MGGLAVVARLAGRTRTVAGRTAAGTLARRSLVCLSRAAIADLRGVIRCAHLVLAASLRHPRQPVNGQRQQREQQDEGTDGAHEGIVVTDTR